MRKIILRDSAADDLDQIDTWLSTVEGARPGKVRDHIRDAFLSLQRLGDIGRPSGKLGVRALSVRDEPYVITYRMDDDTIEILAVYHTAQDR